MNMILPPPPETRRPTTWEDDELPDTIPELAPETLRSETLDAKDLLALSVDDERRIARGLLGRS